MEPIRPSKPKPPPWREARPEIYKRRGSVDQLEATQARVKKALDASYSGELLTDRELELIAQTVLLDLLSSLDPLARAIAARELLELRRATLAGAKERALRAAQKRDEAAQPISVQDMLSGDALAQFQQEFGGG